MNSRGSLDGAVWGICGLIQQAYIRSFSLAAELKKSMPRESLLESEKESWQLQAPNLTLQILKLEPDSKLLRHLNISSLNLSLVLSSGDFRFGHHDGQLSNFVGTSSCRGWNMAFATNWCRWLLRKIGIYLGLVVEYAPMTRPELRSRKHTDWRPSLCPPWYRSKVYFCIRLASLILP